MTLALLAGLALTAESASVLSSSARHLLQRHAARSLRGEPTRRYVPLLIEVTDLSAIERLEEAGVEVNAVAGNIAAARVPLAAVERITRIEGVKRIDGGHRFFLRNDTARRKVGMDLIHQGSNLPRPYTGKGVIYGTFDVGIQFGHKAFTDADGTSRVLLAYLPESEEGEKVTGIVVNEDGSITEGGTLPGSVFPTERLGEVTSDADTQTHGTHTMNTAVGRDIGYPYYGMAPEASIVACGGDELSDAHIACGVALVFDTADRLGCPAVVNLSLGENTGAHDGSSLLPRFLNTFCGAGRIVCVSAGNEGDDLIHVNKKINAVGDSLAVALQGGGRGFSTSDVGVVDFWSDDDTPFAMRLLVSDGQSTLYATPEFVPAAEGGNITFDANTLPELFDYFSQGTVRLSGELADNGRYNISCELEKMKTSQSTYTLCAVIKPQGAAVAVNGWTEPSTGVTFKSLAVEGFTDPDTEQSISNLATAPGIISVGAYSSRQKLQSVQRGETTYTYYPLDDITSFSSYGNCGRQLPDVAAPGAVVVSAINQTATGYGPNGRDTAVYDTQDDGTIIRYSAMWGTSMSSPVVAGAIATWLEADPMLTPDDIREVMNLTADHDQYTEASPERFGAGKFNAYQGLRHILGLSTHVGPTIADGEYSAIAEIYDLEGRRVAVATGIDNDPSLRLAPGFYLVKYRGLNKVKKIYIK